MSTKELREQAGQLLSGAETSLNEGEVGAFEKQITDAKTLMAKADGIDKAASDLKALQGEFNRPVNTVPIASKDVAVYDPNDNTAELKADYKPQSWVKGLPAMAQPMWVQEQMGPNVKAEATFQKDTFMKWMKAPSEQAFFKNATPDEMKAMQEDTDSLLCPIS